MWFDDHGGAVDVLRIWALNETHDDVANGSKIKHMWSEHDKRRSPPGRGSGLVCEIQVEREQDTRFFDAGTRDSFVGLREKSFVRGRANVMAE